MHQNVVKSFTEEMVMKKATGRRDSGTKMAKLRRERGL